MTGWCGVMHCCSLRAGHQSLTQQSLCNQCLCTEQEKKKKRAAGAGLVAERTVGFSASAGKQQITAVFICAPAVGVFCISLAETKMCNRSKARKQKEKTLKRGKRAGFLTHASES